MNPLVLIIPAGLTLILPLLGILAAGRDIAPYLQFPPKPVILSHPPFSPLAFTVIAGFILAAVTPFVKKQILLTKKTAARSSFRKSPAQPLPWWGKAALFSLACCWFLAWTRIDVMKPIQPHTFFPLWFSWIVCVNALVFRRSRR